MRTKISQYFFVINELAKKELNRQHSESNLGALWNVANPLLFLIVMSSLYGTIFKHDVENFPIYFAIGYLIYNLYRTGTMHAMEALVSNKTFLIKTKLPHNIFIIAKVYHAFFVYLYSLIAFLALFLFFKMTFSWTMIFFIPDLLLTLVIIIGIGKILSVIYVFFADIKYLYTVFMTLVLFGSALFYPADRLTGITRMILEINPVYSSITIARDCILYKTIPMGKYWICLLIWSVITYGLGSVLFKKASSNIVQYL